MDDNRPASPEAQALVRLVDLGSVELVSARAFDERHEGPWQDAFGPGLSSWEWSDVLGRLARLLLVWGNAGGMHVIYGLTPLGAQVATALRDTVPALPLSPIPATVFLSHSHKDNEFCQSLDFDLRLHGIRTFFELNDILGGDSIPSKINNGLTDSDYAVLIYTHNSATSKWVQLEYETALSLETQGLLKRPIVVKIDDVALPPILSLRRYLAFGRSVHNEDY